MAPSCSGMGIRHLEDICVSAFIGAAFSEDGFESSSDNVADADSVRDESHLGTADLFSTCLLPSVNYTLPADGFDFTAARQPCCFNAAKTKSCCILSKAQLMSAFIAQEWKIGVCTYSSR